jgi:Flp pilus assembly protein TadG
MAISKSRLMFLRARRASQRGAAAVELALVLPLFLILIAGVYEVGRMAEVQQILSNAAREGARQASTAQISNAAAQQVVLTYLQNALNEGDVTGNTGIARAQNAVITVSDVTKPGTDATAAAQLDQMQVLITLPFKDVRWLRMPLVTSDTTLLTGQASFYSTQDKPYPNSIIPPVGN